MVFHFQSYNIPFYKMDYLFHKDCHKDTYLKHILFSLCLISLSILYLSCISRPSLPEPNLFQSAPHSFLSIFPSYILCLHCIRHSPCSPLISLSHFLFISLSFSLSPFYLSLYFCLSCSPSLSPSTFFLSFSLSFL